MPDTQYIIDLATQLKETYMQRNTRIKALRDRRMGRVQVQIPPEYRKTATEFHSPMVFDMIRRSVAILAGSNPQPKRIPTKQGPDAQKASSSIESWLSHAYRKMNLRTYRQLLDALAADGMAVLELNVDSQKWGGIGRRRKGEEPEEYLERVKQYHRQAFPFSWEQIDSCSFYPVGEPLEETMEISTRKDVVSLARRYGLAVDASGKLIKGDEGMDITQQKWPTEVEHIEYWNDKEFVVLIGEIEVKRGPHRFGRPPYGVARATELSTHDPNDEGISYATPLMSLQDNLDAFVTIQMNWAYLNGFPFMILEPTDENAIETSDAVIEITPGKPFQPPAGYKFAFASVPSVGSDLTQLRDFLKQFSDQVSLAPILFATLPGSNISNATAATMIAVAKSIFGTGVDSIKDMFNDISGLMLKTVEQLGDPVPLYVTASSPAEWLEIGKKEIDGYYQIEHELDPVIPVERMQKAAFLADGHARGHISRRVTVEDGYGYHDPEAMRKERLLEDLEDAPEVRQLIIGETMREWDIQAQAEGTPANVPKGMGGPGAVTTPGIQSPLLPQGETMMPAQTPLGEGIGRG